MMKKKIAFTGSAGFLGTSIYQAFEGDYELRLADVAEFNAGHEKMIGDVVDFDFCKRLVDGMDYLVIGHMYPRPYGVVPTRIFDVNVTGTANLLYAAVQSGVKRVALISSVAACSEHDPAVDLNGLRPKGSEMYSTTKACQEIIAEAIHEEFGLEIASIRIGYVVDCRSKVNKYGNVLKEFVSGMIDRGDVGIVTRKFIEIPGLKYEVRPAYSFSEPGHYPSGIATFQYLNWRSCFDTSTDRISAVTG
ncbi:NAD(P)-dependent oxidoreductase [Rubellicoccus peritrichatus]|uniref:NAD(P)-dependent oxidoreductase n=1 Tax=Rubellicoccus peritrichatus TaxID=3080537 RepID=A0AAQ3QTC6_9BACT|nr:NAD(P)-dependent oxidoreductase [Puniceicoccus sp. CR14]WOO43568.1 NAD(P)-dependent oxidoreductase [Puniceicoccus sp. CR14]